MLGQGMEGGNNSLLSWRAEEGAWDRRGSSVKGTEQGWDCQAFQPGSVSITMKIPFSPAKKSRISTNSD